MKYILAALITAFALTANAGIKKPCKPGQTEADGCHVVKKAEKKKPAPKKAPAKKAPVKQADKKKK